MLILYTSITSDNGKYLISANRNDNGVYYGIYFQVKPWHKVTIDAWDNEVWLYESLYRACRAGINIDPDNIKDEDIPEITEMLELAITEGLFGEEIRLKHLK